MPYAFLAVCVLGVLGVANAYRPLRREPLSVVSFFAGWLVGELAIQNIVWEAVVTVVFGVFGAFTAWPGYLGLALAAVGWVGLVGLAVGARRDRRVVADALARDLAGLPTAPVALPAPQWGSWWRTLRAVSPWGRHCRVVKNVDYWGDRARRHRLDVVTPRSGAAGAPVMVYVHGGGWVIGDKREQGKPMMNELVARGWVCVTINYRLSPKATWPDHIVDCKRAIAWVREHIAEYGGDPSFVAVSGGSAGGHLCSLAALSAGDPEWQPGFESADTSVDACVPFYGVTDMTGDPSTSGKFGPGLLEMLERLVMKVKAAEDPQVFRRASPTLRVHAGAPPFFVLQGANDSLVPVEVARQFVDALRAVSAAPVAYTELPLAQHAFDVLASPRCSATTAGVIAFLDAVRAAPGAKPAEDARIAARDDPPAAPDGEGPPAAGR